MTTVVIVVNLSKHIAVIEAPNYFPDDEGRTNVVHPKSVDELRAFFESNSATKTYIVCDNPELLEYACTNTNANIYATVYENQIHGKNVDSLCLQNYEIASYSQTKFSDDLQSKYRHITFSYGCGHDEHKFLDLLKDILENGNKRDDRTCVGTISVFSRQLRFDISRSLPVLTTKFVPWKMVLKELLWFLRGETDSKTLEAQGVHIWKGNSTREFLDNRKLHHYRDGDIGPMYGFAWRHWGSSYEGCDANYSGEGFDQIAELIKGLKSDPFSRRHLLTTFNPADVEKSALAPCHGVATMFYVEQDKSGESKGHLSCHVVCRSSDTFLGLSFNIASYAMLACIIAKKCDMKPKELIVSTGDTHIYNTHIEQVNLQLSRSPLPFPVLEISDAVREKAFEDITVEDFEVVGYIHHPTIKAPMAV